jgi:spermidine synthase
MDLWYTEKHSENVGITLKATKTLFSGKSEFQQLDIIETVEYGRMMLLDGLVMCTERDEFVYHDMITHPALFTHPNPKQVLVIGGGDGGTIREIMKHKNVELATLCEIDGLVIDKSVELLPSMACEIDGKNPRVKLHVDDGLAYIRDHQNEFDVIMVDSTDPIGPAVAVRGGLLSPRLRRPETDGIMVAQSESPSTMPRSRRTCTGTCARSSRSSRCTRPSSRPTFRFRSFAFASKKYHPVRDFDRERAKTAASTKYC